jgi:pyridinium-3,5-biscarboxylic acid mononucleotide synthase
MTRRIPHARSGSSSRHRGRKALKNLEPVSIAFESLGFATVDHHRETRQGFPEVILCEGKTPSQVAAIARSISNHGSVLLGTRAGLDHYRAVRRVLSGARYNRLARTITANEHLVAPRGTGTILVVTAGTSDIPVAEEARETATMMGNTVERLYDVGVAGIHRLLLQSATLRKASVVVVVAGMEGALASVVGGLVDVPVIAVPTSIGYGANFAGVSALLGMLNSCAAGVTVVNIDNGFGAGYAAGVINRTR